MGWEVRDWRDERIAELEAESAAKDARIADLEAQVAARDARIATLEEQVAMLMKRVGELEEKLRQNSRNSHLPPSSDSPSERKQRDKSSSGSRKRGGQPGHGGSRRELLSDDEVDEVVDLYPSDCENCWEALPKVPDRCAHRYQQTEMPAVKPHTTEWRRHQVTCRHCGYKTRATYDEKVIPPSPFGPRLMATMAMITGIYHVSRRSAVGLLSDLLGVRVSLGALSAVEARVGEAVQPVVDEAWDRVRSADVKHTDGTSWYQSGLSMALWTIATTAATVFKIVADSSKKTLQPLYGALTGILVSDRATSLTFWAMERRQICWAHLIRKFVSFSERDGPAGAFGRQLLDYTGIVFDYWHDYKAGKLDRATLVAWMAPVKKQVRELLDKAVAANVAQLSGACADILDHAPALWTFVETDGVEPTNNHAEQQIRAFVLWRKRSFGTQSARGNVFAANLMTVAHTARKQKKNVLALLVECCKARREGTRAPSLFDPPLATPAAAAA
jgi:transposase